MNIYMEKLLKFSYWAAVISTALTVTNIACNIIICKDLISYGYHYGKEIYIINIFTSFGYSILLLFLFLSIITKSAKTSPLKIPSRIIIAGVVLCMTALVIYLIYNLIDNDFFYRHPKFITASQYMMFAYQILFCAGLIWLSRFFEKDSMVKIVSIIYAVLPLSTSIIIIGLRSILHYNIIVSITDLGFSTIISACIPLFFYSFSRIGKNAGK